MGIVKRLLVGKVIKDFGLIQEKGLKVGRSSTRALLVEKRGKLWFVLQSSAWVFLGANVHYLELELDEAYQLGEYIDQAKQLVREMR